MSDTLQPMDCSPPGFSVCGDSPGKNTGVDCHSLLQGIFPIQTSNLGLLHSRQILRYCTDDGRRKRHRAPKKPWKARWRDIWDTVKVFVFSPLIFAILFVLIVLVVNTVLVLHWDSF